jgi:hypothetical protein
MPRELNNVVQQTTEYSKFNLLSANRDVNGAHVRALKRSIETLGNITEKVPIIVNQNLEIIDGQHRFVALKELGLPVFYIVAEGMGVKHARDMNILNKGWRPEDYAKSYSVEGRTSYTNYLILREEYPEMNHSGLVVAVSHGESKGVYAKFRNGDLVLNNMSDAHKILDMVSELAEITPAFYNQKMSRALAKVFEIEGYDHERMVEKVKSDPTKVVVYQNSDDNLRLLEDIYNSYMRSNRLRFF